MAKISEDIRENKKISIAVVASNIFSSGVFQPSTFQNTLQTTNITLANCIDSDMDYKDRLTYKSESYIQTSSEAGTSKRVCAHGPCQGLIVDQGRNTISAEAERFQETSSKYCAYDEEKMELLEPPSKRFRSLSRFPHDSKYSHVDAEIIAVQTEDEYDHVTSGLVYVITSYPGSGVPLDMYEDHIEGCKCGGLCSDDCKCTFQYGCPYENGKLNEQHYRKPIFECNDWCNCSDDCPNRVVQRGPVGGLKVISFQGKGYGVMSSYFIPKNSFICEYAGEYIGVEEARLRFSKQDDKDSNYILVLKEYVQGSTSDPCTTIIDPTVVGNIGRYMNHSCDPNLMVVPVRINSMLPLAALFATRDILPGEELCYDYSNIMMHDNKDEESSVFLTNKTGTSEIQAYNQISEIDMTNIPTSCRDIVILDKASHVYESSPKTEGCEGLNVLSSDRCLVEGDEPKGDSSSRLRKPCCCNAKNCRQFLPVDKDII